jgi:hypothetical protein
MVDEDTQRRRRVAAYDLWRKYGIELPHTQSRWDEPDEDTDDRTEFAPPC